MISIALLSPVYSDFTPEFVMSMNDTFRVARARGWSVDSPEFLYEQGSMLVRARNSLANQALVHTNATHFVWADADMLFDGETVANMIETDEPVVGVNAPSKDGGFVFDGPLPLMDSRLVEVTAIGFGLVTMTRGALEQFVEVGGFREETGCDRHLGEDICFSHDWRKAGGKLFVFADANIGHVGRTLFRGNFAHQRLGVERQDRR